MDTINYAIKLLNYTGSYTLQEPVSHLEHALQAYWVAKNIKPDDIELRVAAFWHDIGHSLAILHSAYSVMTDKDGNILGASNHEELGAEIFSKIFPERVLNGIRYHTLAKRYASSTMLDYQLSVASAETMTYQGGKLTADEAKLFESRRDFEFLMDLRAADDQAKVPNFIFKTNDNTTFSCNEIFNMAVRDSISIMIINTQA